MASFKILMKLIRSSYMHYSDENEALWDIKDKLRGSLDTYQLKRMLEYNNQDSKVIFQAHHLRKLLINSYANRTGRRIQVAR